jgi:hypothetical protein
MPSKLSMNIAICMSIPSTDNAEPNQSPKNMYRVTTVIPSINRSSGNICDVQVKNVKTLSSSIVHSFPRRESESRHYVPSTVLLSITLAVA